ncbi:hypothetical protein [Pseudoxanthomonas sp. Soil82]|uniref:hypothetical protein n=1 Tax=Pseudoxanthomonas sp. Soil82 TaxID=3157341 RepID=UPI00338D387A
MTGEPSVQKHHFQIGEGVVIDVSIQPKATGVSVPKPRPVPRRIGVLKLDIGDLTDERNSFEVEFTFDLNYRS